MTESTTTDTETTEASTSVPTESPVITAPEPVLFRDLIDNATVLAALDAVGFTKATPVQVSSLPLALGGRDLMLQAKTGSGKTLAFVLPMLSLLAATDNTSETVALILTPTRELASQICVVIRSLTKNVEPVCVIGGMSIGGQIRELERDKRVVVGTPGRILDLLRQRELSFRSAKFFAVDEVDEMFSMDFAEDVRAILSRLPDQRQGLFVSATISPKVEMLANNFLTNPEKIVISTPGELMPPVEHLYYEVKGEVTAKANALCDIIETYSPRSAIVFCNTKSDTELVQAFLARRGYDAEFLNSDLNQRQRDHIMTTMREGKLRLLVGTDLAARGLDIESLDLVVNYALPDQPEVYTHRTGRTGRAGRSGRAISLIGPQDFMAWVMIRRGATMEITKQELPTEEEVTTARVAHLHSLLREQGTNLGPKDMQLAVKFLKDAGVDSPTDDLAALVGKLCTSFIEQSASTHRRRLEADKAAEGQPQGEGAAPGNRADDRRPQNRDSDRRGGSNRGGGGGRGGGYGDRRR